MRALTAALAVVLAAGCEGPPALKTDARKIELVRELQRALSRSVENEKLAVLAVSDEDSARFAGASKQAAAEVDRLRAELRALASEEERARLDDFDAAWAKAAALDAQLLKLATENANLKASALSQGQAMKDLEAVEAGFGALEDQTNDPPRLRALSRAARAALEVQALHAPHIDATTDATMDALDAKVHAREAEVDAVLAPGHKPPPKAEAAALATLGAAWAAYKADTAQVLALSRSNSNVKSLDLSLHDKVRATLACDASLDALAAQVHATPRATR